MHKHEKSALLGQTIRERSATADGFDVTDCPQGGSKKAAHQRCRLMIERGELFKGRAHYRLIRYFDNQAAATAFVKANSARAACQRSGAAVLLTPKPGKFTISPRVVKAPAAPRPDAVPVHTANTRYTSRMMGPGRYEVSVPMVRMGSEQWRAGVGA